METGFYEQKEMFIIWEKIIQICTIAIGKDGSYIITSLTNSWKIYEHKSRGKHWEEIPFNI